MTYLPHTDEDRRRMLDAIGVSDIDELLVSIPERLRVKTPLDLPPPASEMEILSLLKELSSSNGNLDSYISFLGAGVYDHFIPSVVQHIISRPEYYTAYTPYQPEVSQGTLTAIFEYQTMIAELTGMEVSNASVYDGGSAVAEAAVMALSMAKKRRSLVVSKGVHPFYREVLKTYLTGQDVKLTEVPLAGGFTDAERLFDACCDDTAAIIIQSPNFVGSIEDLAEMGKAAKSCGAFFIAVVDPISLGVLKPPGEFGADIVVGEGQVLGNPPAFGGPLFGFFACKDEYKRYLPGRLVGETVDVDGKRGFVLTLQTREQHIRREKATSNICTNQALNALAATVYMSLMGKEGLRQVALLCLKKAHYTREKLAGLSGFSFPWDSHIFKEFPVKPPVAPGEIIERLKTKGILAGVDAGCFDRSLEGILLVAVTERRTREDIDRLIEALAE
ncbi:MAG: aminomethyl-transferring glycine dehydrogenase subunit GcvPA [Candidatus Glassbacteria bacterium]